MPYGPNPVTNRQIEHSSLQVSGARQRGPTPRLKISEDGRIDLDHADPVAGFNELKASLGTTDNNFTGGLLEQLSNIGSRGDEQAINFNLSMIQGVEPTDQIETMLATQMAAVHNATMTYADRLNQADTVAQQDSAARAFNNLAKTFTSQVEALKRYRTGGQQKIVVQHINVEEGGRAIVGNIDRGVSNKLEPTS
jgi:hypothetical protein